MLSLSLLLALATSLPLSAATPTKRPADAVKGRMLYEDHCWQCHGPSGLGDGPLSPGLGQRLASLRGTDRSTWPALVDLIQQGAGDMPAFAEVMDRHDTRRILVWLEALDQDERPDDLEPTRSATTPLRAPAQDTGEPPEDDAPDEDGR